MSAIDIETLAGYMKVRICSIVAEAIEAERAAVAAERWGVFCVGEGWYVQGTRDEMEQALPDWASGRRADVNARDFRYEMRRVPKSEEEENRW